MNKMVKIAIVSVRKLVKTQELFATVGAIFPAYLNPLVHLRNTVKYL